MAVPKKKTSSSRRDRRRSHHAISQPKLATCQTCGAPHRPHRVCENCGSYRGRRVATVEGTE